MPTVGLCMGDIGLPTRVLGGKFGAPFTYATFHRERVLAPGQLSFEEMTEGYHYDDINRDTQVYGVVADPVGHSLSPLIHNASFRRLKLNKVYLPFRVPKEDLGRFMEDAAELDIRGLSVTIPHKEAVLEHLTNTDTAVQGIGAANTVVLHDGQRLGYNTDCQSAMVSLEEAMPGPKQPGSPLRGKTVLVLGAGGVGKAIAFGLVARGATVVLSDGDAERATMLASRLRCRSVDWSIRTGVMADVVVNGTPIGMHPNVDDTPLTRGNLRPAMVVFDAVYNPENTLLIKEARQRGCKVVTGVDMFVRQAALQFKHFTGHDAPTDLMREVLKRATSAAK